MKLKLLGALLLSAAFAAPALAQTVEGAGRSTPAPAAPAPAAPAPVAPAPPAPAAAAPAPVVPAPPAPIAAAPAPVAPAAPAAAAPSPRRAVEAPASGDYIDQSLSINREGRLVDHSGRGWGPHGRNWNDGWRHEWRGRDSFALGFGFGAPYDGYYDGGYRGGYATTRDDGYCARRYRSYDPQSGTYLGYDGRPHPCP